MMFRMQRVAGTVLICGGLLMAAGCKQEEPPPPPKPSAVPLADTAPKTTSDSATPPLPPGHPPITGPMAAGPIPEGAEMPPNHPPINGVVPGGQNGEGAALPPGHPAVGGNSGGMGGMSSALASGDEKMLGEAPTTFAGITLTPPDGWKAFDAGSGPMSPVAAFVLPKADGDDADAVARLTYFPSMRGMPNMVEMNLSRWYGMVQQPDGKPTSEVAKKSVFEAHGATVTLVDMPGTIEGKPDQRMLAAIIEHPQGPHFLKVAGPDATIAQWRDAVVEYLASATVTE